MLVVRTYVAASKINGLGVFAAQPIPRNHPVWVEHSIFNIVLTPEQVATLPPVSQDYIEKYAWTDDVGAQHIGVDADKYINHSDDPNCGWVAAGAGISVALRDIEADEEITEDYKTYCNNPSAGNFDD